MPLSVTGSTRDYDARMVSFYLSPLPRGAPPNSIKAHERYLPNHPIYPPRLMTPPMFPSTRPPLRRFVRNTAAQLTARLPWFRAAMEADPIALGEALQGVINVVHIFYVHVLVQFQTTYDYPSALASVYTVRLVLTHAYLFFVSSSQFTLH